jgi:hypothetical protein
MIPSLRDERGALATTDWWIGEIVVRRVDNRSSGAYTDGRRQLGQYA